MSASVQVNGALWHPHLGEYRVAKLTFILIAAFWVMRLSVLMGDY